MHATASRALLLPWILVCLLSGASRGQGVVEAARREARPEVVARLEAYVDWCIEHKRFADRDAACREILGYEPHHERARRILKYRRDRDGQWEQRGYRERPNQEEALDEESAARRAAAVAPLTETLFEHWREGYGVLSGAERRELEEACTALAPDDPEMRAAFGHVRHPERDAWVLRETLRAEERRALVKRWLGELRAEHAPAPSTPTAEELALGDWRGAFETDLVRVLAASGAEEARSTAGAVDAALRLLGRVVGDERPIVPVVVLLLDGEAGIEGVLAARPQLADRIQAGSAQRVGAWDGENSTLFLWNPTAPERAEEAVEQALVWAFARLWNLGADPGWLYYGLMAYVTELVLGDSSKLHPDVPPPGEEPAAGDPWSGALAAVREAEPPDWGALLSAPAAELNELDRWRACVFTRFVAEAYPHRLARIVPRLASGMTMEAAFDLPQGAGWGDLGARVLRWTEEVDPHGARESLLALVEVDAARAAEFVERFRRLPSSQRRDLARRCREAALASGAPQVERVAALAASVGPLPQLPEVADFPAHDAREHLGGPPRRVIGKGHRLWDALVPGLEVEPADPRPDRDRRVRYEFSTGHLALVDPHELPDRDEAHAVALLLAGRLPDQDLAEEALLAAFDAAGPLREEARFFAHLYCDREANAYDGLTLFDMWSSGAVVEVPDPDARAYAHLVAGDDTIPVPLSASDQQHWYPRMRASLRELRTYELATRALSAVWLEGRPELGAGYADSVDLLNALATLAEGDPAQAGELWARHGAETLQAVRDQMAQRGDAAWDAANARRDRLAAGVDTIRRAVVDVLLDTGLL